MSFIIFFIVLVTPTAINRIMLAIMSVPKVFLINGLSM